MYAETTTKLDNRTLSTLRTMVQQWQIQSWRMRERAVDCPEAAPYYNKVAGSLDQARLGLEKALSVEGFGR